MEERYGNIRAGDQRICPVSRTKVALNLTKRQIICFSGAAVAGIPCIFNQGIDRNISRITSYDGSNASYFSFLQCMRKRVSGGEDFVFYAPAEDTHTGHKTIPVRKIYTSSWKKRKITKGGSLS